MKDMREFQGLGGFTSTSKLIQIQFYLLLILGMMSTGMAWGQAPGLIWSTNVGATVISVDANTNIYAELNSDQESIVTLNSLGVPLRTNKISTFPGLAGRDAAGNFYFAGNVTPPLYFTNGATVFTVTNLSAIAKYDSTGHAIWAYGFGVVPGFLYNSLTVSDLKVDPSGIAYVTWSDTFADGQEAASYLQSFSDATNTDLNLSFSDDLIEPVDKVTLTSSNSGYILSSAVDTLSTQATAFTLCSFTNQSATTLASWIEESGVSFGNSTLGNSRPVPDRALNVYDVEDGFLTKRTPSGAFIWHTYAEQGFDNVGCVASDFYDGVQTADNLGLLARYDSAGNLIWSTNVTNRVNAMITDSNGNRFFSRDDGVISRLMAEAMPVTVITNQPQGGTVFVGDSFAFTVGASGFTPFNYTWLYQSNSTATAVPVPGATNGTLAFTAVTANQDGFYSVVISNAVNSVTSAPVRLQVKSVEIYADTNILDAGSYLFSSPPTLTIRSAFTNGEIFYTLDGSTPSFTSTSYTQPFVLSSSATINAIGYSSDFSQSALADPVIATVPTQFTLSFSTPGGGTIGGQVIGGPAGSAQSGAQFASNTLVNLTAFPATGFTFLGWQGTIVSSSPTINVRMNQNQTLTAIFGTTLSTTVTGNGQVVLSPPVGPYAYGTVVRLEAEPQPGNAFGAWGNAAAGSSTSPLYFTVTNATPTLSSIFGPTPANEAALTVLVVGKGRVAASPTGNAFATNASVTLTATPDAGQHFIDWSGSVSSTQNPLTVAMTQARVVVANFSGQSASFSTNGIVSLGLGREGLQFTIVGEPQGVYKIQSSTNLVSWLDVALYTNDTGELQLISPQITNATGFYRLEIITP